MSNGLDGVVAAETILSDVDGEAGRLVLRGHPLAELAGNWRFEAVASLLFEGFFPDPPPLDLLARRLGEARAQVFGEVATPLPEQPPFEAMRALTARLGDGEDLATALRLLAAPAVFTAVVLRRARGEAPVPPDPARSHAEDCLHMLTGRTPSIEAVRALDTYLVTVADHGLNASTFAARVVASTQAGLTSAALAALGALKGPLHGGAPGPVLDMLDAIGTPAQAEDWIAAALGRGERLMGFGHRLYRVRDPRADALKAALRRLAASPRLALAETVEAAALRQLSIRKPDRPLKTNVEFYTALLLDALGYPREAFTCVFAMGRMAG